MTLRRRTLAGLLACASTLAVALPATAQGAPAGVNVSYVSDEGDPFVQTPGGADSARAWQDLEQSGAKTLRTFVQWTRLRGSTRELELRKYELFAQKARARGLTVVLTVTGTAGSMATPAEYAAVARDLAARLRGNVAAYEVWNEPDGATFWANGPQPGAYTALLKAAYGAFKGGDPAAKVLVGGLVGNDFEFLEAIYASGGKGAFDGVGVHTDTACLTTDPREYYREPSGRIGRYSFTGYREVRRTMLAHGDDKPIWMTELGWSSSTATCADGDRAGTKPRGVSREQQADFLSKAYACLANDPYVEQAAWFNLHDIHDTDDLGLITRSFTRKPAFTAFQRAGAATAIACGGTLDMGTPDVRFVAPTDGAQYLTSLAIDIRATDDEGVRDIDLLVDGKEVSLRTVRSGRGASVKFEWGGAKNLSYGPHTLVALARDEARNEGRATARVIHVGGGDYPFKVATKLALNVGKVRGGKVAVSGKVRPQGGIAPRAHGRTYIAFARFDAKAKRWKRYSRYSKDAKTAFRFTHRFKQAGRWRVSAVFKPKAGFKRSRNTIFVKVR